MSPRPCLTSSETSDFVLKKLYGLVSIHRLPCAVDIYELVCHHQGILEVVPCTPPLPGSLEESIVNIKLKEMPIIAKCHREDNPDYGRLDNWDDGHVEVNARSLSESFCN